MHERILEKPSERHLFFPPVRRPPTTRARLAIEMIDGRTISYGRWLAPAPGGWQMCWWPWRQDRRPRRSTNREIGAGLVLYLGTVRERRVYLPLNPAAR